MAAGVVGSAMHAMAVTFTVIASGTLLRAQGVLSAVGQRELAAVAVRLLLPTYNFSALVAEVTWDRLESCRAAAFASVLHICLGLACGTILCQVAGERSEFLSKHKGQVLVLCGFVNATAMPLPLFRALLGAPELQGAGLEAEGALAITVYGAVWRFCLWTFGIALLHADVVTDGDKGVGGAKFFRTALMNSNTMAGIAGFAVALTGSEGLIFGGPLAFLREACANISKASHTCLLLALGAALWPIPSAADWKATAGICFVKLVIMPIITLAALSVVDVTPINGLIIAIEGSVPSALQISMMVQSTGQDPRTCTFICFWQHLVALVTMTSFVAVALARFT